MKKVLTTRLAMMILTLIAVMLVGCGEEEQITESSATDILSAVKTPKEAAMAPQAPSVGVPFVTEVGYYSDWKFTKPLTGAVAAGKTIYIKVAFSEDMTVVVADDTTARPVLFCQIDREMTRFHIVRHNAKLGNGDAKQRGKDAATFVCRYTVRPEDAGRFSLTVGKLSTDTDDVRMAAVYRHKEKLQLGDTEPPVVRAVTYWRTEDLTDPLTDIVRPGADVYTKITFSEAMKVTAGDDEQRRPVLHYQIGRERVRYRIVAEGDPLQHGDAQSMSGGTAFVCRNTIPTDTIGSFWVAVGTLSEDTSGNRMADFYVHTRRLRIEPEPVPEPISEPEPETPQGTATTDYTYNFEGEIYPGYDPTPKLQHILDTHPSAQLPFFEEAVRMVEVLNWVHRRAWEKYIYTNPDKFAEVKDAVSEHFGLPRNIRTHLSTRYFRTAAHRLPGHSRYWLLVEYLRLKQEHPDATMWELLGLFEKSTGNVVGIENPNTGRTYAPSK